MPDDPNAFYFATQVRRETARLLQMREVQLGSRGQSAVAHASQSYELIMAQPDDDVFDLGICVTFDETDALWRLGAIPSLTIEAALLACRTAGYF